MSQSDVHHSTSNKGLVGSGLEQEKGEGSSKSDLANVQAFINDLTALKDFNSETKESRKNYRNSLKQLLEMNSLNEIDVPDSSSEDEDAEKEIEEVSKDKGEKSEYHSIHPNGVRKIKSVNISDMATGIINSNDSSPFDIFAFEAAVRQGALAYRKPRQKKERSEQKDYSLEPEHETSFQLVKQATEDCRMLNKENNNLDKILGYARLWMAALDFMESDDPKEKAKKVKTINEYKISESDLKFFFQAGRRVVDLIYIISPRNMAGAMILAKIINPYRFYDWTEPEFISFCAVLKICYWSKDVLKVCKKEIQDQMSSLTFTTVVFWKVFEKLLIHRVEDAAEDDPWKGILIKGTDGSSFSFGVERKGVKVFFCKSSKFDGYNMSTNMSAEEIAERGEDRSRTIVAQGSLSIVKAVHEPSTTPLAMQNKMVPCGVDYLECWPDPSKSDSLLGKSLFATLSKLPPPETLSENNKVEWEKLHSALQHLIHFYLFDDLLFTDVIQKASKVDYKNCFKAFCATPVNEGTLKRVEGSRKRKEYN